MAVATQKIIIHADDKTGAAIASAIRNSQRLDNQLKKTTDNMRGMTRQGRAQMGQLGHQMQDVAVQLQMGMNPLMILGQQGSQIASIFGSGGAVFGSFIAIGAVIASVFIPQLFEASRASGEFHDDIIKAAGGVDKLTEAQRKLAELDLKLRINEQQLAVENAQKAIEEFEAKMSKLNETANGNGRSARGAAMATKRLSGDTTELSQNLELAKATLAATKEQMDLLTGSTEAQTRATEALSLAQKKANRDALERMKLIMDSMSAEQKFTMEAARLQKILAGPDGIFDATETEAYRVAIEGLAETYFKAGKAVDEAKDKTKEYGLSMEDVKMGGLKSMEDGLVAMVEGTKSVKDAFKDMVRSVISDLIRMQIQQSITIPLANMMPGMQLAGKRAAGGPVSAGKPYLVGERGPEIMIPQGAGRIVSNQDSSSMGAGSTVVNVNISTGVSQTVRAEITNLLPQITNAAKSAVADARQRGGGYSKALVGA
jgi:hypothetical protein